MEKISADLAVTMFAAGACRSAMEHGMDIESAKSFAAGLCKSAASGRRPVWDYDEEDDTFWNRNKNWLLPLMVGTAAFYIGASGERNGRKDRSYFHNALNNIGNKMDALFGIVKDPLYNSATAVYGHGSSVMNKIKDKVVSMVDVRDGSK